MGVGRDEPAQVFPRLQRTDRQHEATVFQPQRREHGRADFLRSRLKARFHAQMDSDDLLVGQSIDVVNFLLRVVAVRNDDARLSKRAGQSIIQILDGHARVEFGVPPMGQIVDRDNGRSAVARRDEIRLVIEVATFGEVPTQTPRSKASGKRSSFIDAGDIARGAQSRCGEPLAELGGLGQRRLIAHQRTQRIAFVDGRAHPSGNCLDIRLLQQSFEQVLRVVADAAARRPQRIEIKKQFHAMAASRGGVEKRGERRLTIKAAMLRQEAVDFPIIGAPGGCARSSLARQHPG